MEKYRELLKTILGIEQRNINADEMSPVKLAYIGDSIYDVFVRTYLLLSYDESVNKTHKRAVEFVKASAQSEALARIYNLLDENELYVLKRGRNAKSGKIPQYANVQEYRRSTAFEALIGYLYLSGNFDRLYFLVIKSFDLKIIGDEDTGNLWEK